MENSKYSFEQEIQNKMDQLESNPSNKVWDQLDHDLPQATTAKAGTNKWIMIGVTAIAGAILTGLLWTYLNTETNQPVEEKENVAIYASASNNVLKINRIADAVKLMEKASKDILFLSIDMHTCPICAKMEVVTLENEVVADFLSDHFVQTKIERTEPEFDIIRKNYGINAFPSFIFMNKNGQVIDIIRGFREPEVFLEILEMIIESESRGEYMEFEPVEEKRENVSKSVSSSLELTVYPEPK